MGGSELRKQVARYKTYSLTGELRHSYSRSGKQNGSCSHVCNVPDHRETILLAPERARLFTVLLPINEFSRCVTQMDACFSIYEKQRTMIALDKCSR